MSLISILKNSAERYSKKIALIEAEKEHIITYAELYQKVETYALFLKAHGLEPSQKIAIYMPNSFEYIVALFAILCICGVPVLIDHRFSEREVRECLEATSTDILLTSIQQQNIGLNLHKQGMVKKIFILSSDPFPSAPLTPPCIHHSLAAFRPADDIATNSSAQGGKIRPAVTDTGRKLILFTYRGYGYVLPVLLNEQAIEANVLSNNDLTRINEHTIISLILPLSHIFALSCNFLSPLSVGATIVIINSLAPAAILTFFEYYKLNLLAAVPSQIYILLHALQRKHYNLSALKRGVIGGDSPGKSLFQDWKELTGGSILVQGYGLTETCAVICNNWQDNRPESLGKVMKGSTAQVRDETGKRELVNREGCLWLRTESLMEGYLNQPVVNNQVIQGGWFDTGDMAFQDKNGFFYFVKRIKPVAKIGATTVDIQEVKEIISRLPGISEVKIEVDKDPLWQEKLVCSLKSKKSITSMDIKSYCKSCLAFYKIPKDIHILIDNT